IEWCRWSTYEPRIARTFDHILTVTEQDKLLLQWLTKKSTISYFPRGLTIPESLPAYSKREPFSLLFVGSFSHAPNVDAVRWLVKEILPDVIRRVPQLTCYIIGHNPPAELVQSSLHHTQIKFLGFVKDLSHYLDRSQVFIAPMKTGGGVKVKILEAMAHGIPVVTTKIGAEGIEGISPNNCMIGNSVHQITEQVCTLFHNPMQAEELGRQGYLNTIRYYSLERCVMNIEQTYQSILQHQ
ncbi:MAG: glycosyltransferase, partial [Ignavibacteriae bacterium]|nr:glycosyltransferase [Ignavibacteriota bacterium]